MHTYSKRKHTENKMDINLYGLGLKRWCLYRMFYYCTFELSQNNDSIKEHEDVQFK